MVLFFSGDTEISLEDGENDIKESNNNDLDFDGTVQHYHGDTY
jgi:hypothetical protein